MKYYCNDKFDNLPAASWGLLLDRTLPKAGFIELKRLFTNAPIPEQLVSASVSLPESLDRIDGATHRFSLTPEVTHYIKSKSFKDWHNNDFEDLAFYQDDLLLLGTITHENYVVMALDETEREELNRRGFDFWCEWSFSQ